MKKGIKTALIIAGAALAATAAAGAAYGIGRIADGLGNQSFETQSSASSLSAPSVSLSFPDGRVFSSLMSPVLVVPDASPDADAGVFFSSSDSTLVGFLGDDSHYLAKLYVNAGSYVSVKALAAFSGSVVVTVELVSDYRVSASASFSCSFS
jgi:hypothetical protein